MSKDEAKDISLRELVRHNISMMEAHREESDLFRNKVNRMLTEIEIHSIYSKEKIDTYGKDIKALNTAKDIQTGFLAALSAIGLMGIYNFFKNLIQ